jgi:hypothetical protein
MTERKKLGKKSEDKAFPKVYIATPAYDGRTHTDYAQSMLETGFACGSFGIWPIGAVMGNGAFIDLSRCMFANIFLTDPDYADCTHFFFIDADLKWEARAFVELVRHCTDERPVVCGAYRKRQDIEEYPVRWKPHPELSKDGIDRLWYDDDGWLMADRVPTGFLCIKRFVLEEMAAEAERMIIKNHGEVPRLFYTYINEKNQFIGEDFAFCDDYVKKYGKPISVWTDFDFIHDGWKGNYQKWIVKNAVEIDKDTGYAVRKKVGERKASRDKKNRDDRSAA